MGIWGEKGCREWVCLALQCQW